RDDHGHYEPKLGYASSHTYALEAVPDGSRVMDLGAGPGHLARELVEKRCSVTLVDRLPPTQGPRGTEGMGRDLDSDPLELDLSRVDVLLLLDVIEHLREPERFLTALRRNLDHRPRTLVLTTPNVAFVIQRLMLLAGQFNYGKAGILDRTHTRLLTFRSLPRVLGRLRPVFPNRAGGRVPM